MLLERAIPGVNLAEGFKRKESSLVSLAIEVLKAIQMDAPGGVDDAIILDDWFANLERARGSEFPSEYVEKALQYYSWLTYEVPIAYFHGDFHPGNIVTATRSPFLAIDPKGIIGPVGYDIAVFLNNLYWGQGDDVDHDNMKAMLVLAINQFSAAFDISHTDLRRWAFSVQVLGRAVDV